MAFFLLRQRRRAPRAAASARRGMPTPRSMARFFDELPFDAAGESVDEDVAAAEADDVVGTSLVESVVTDSLVVELESVVLLLPLVVLLVMVVELADEDVVELLEVFEATAVGDGTLVILVRVVQPGTSITSGSSMVQQSM